MNKKTYLITYDYKDLDDVPSAFFDALQSFGDWWHFIDGSWLIRAELDANGIYARLEPFLDSNLHLLIVEVGRDMCGWLPRNAWDWIRKIRSSDTPSHQQVAPLDLLGPAGMENKIPSPTADDLAPADA